MSRRISLMIVATALPCIAFSSQPFEPSVPFHMRMGCPVVDGIFLNGQGPFRFLLDTGAQTNQVQASIAAKLGLTPMFRTNLISAVGGNLVVGGHIAAVSLGPATGSNQEFLFTSLDFVHTLSAEIQGVLGQEFLSRFDYLLDFANRRLVFGAAAPDTGSRVRFEAIDGRPAIETSAGKLVLDYGTDTTILFRASSSAPDARIVTASGPGSVSTIQCLRLRIAGREYRSAKAASIPRGSLDEDGVLPASLFHAVFVSNSGKYAILDPLVNASATSKTNRRSSK